MTDLLLARKSDGEAPVGWVTSSLNQFAGCWRLALLEHFVCHNNLTQHSFSHRFCALSIYSAFAVIDSEMLDEYDFSKGVRRKYAQRYTAGSNLVGMEDCMEEIREDGAQEKETEEESSEARPEEKELTAEEEQKDLTPDQEMVRMQQEVEQANDMMLRLAAELDNYKKRVAKERESLIRYAVQDVLQELIPILDNFERATESANKSKDFNSFLEGVKMIYRNMYDVMGRKGLVRIDAVGETFDPNIHEAVMQVTSQEHPENVVVEELQKGYMLHDRVIRPSMVVVSKGKGEESNG